MMGANITMPYKTDVIQYLDELSPDAEIMGAVNLIRKDGEKLIGENTDGKGFMRSLIEDADVNAKGKKVVLLGAGGAARAIAVELALSGASSIIIVNRTESRAKALASLLIEKTNIRAKSDKWDTSYIIPEDTNILINATSIGFSPDINSRPDIEYASISRGMIVCDVVMNPPRTLFLQEAEIRGATVIDGLGMIAYQGAIGFKMWIGIGAPVQVMKDALKHEFNI
jgi:shikimate dehydrogenase